LVATIQATWIAVKPFETIGLAAAMQSPSDKKVGQLHEIADFRVQASRQPFFALAEAVRPGDLETESGDIFFRSALRLRFQLPENTFCRMAVAADQLPDLPGQPVARRDAG
jgi:hypothetical protein